MKSDPAEALMLDTRPNDDTCLRCDALFDRVAATPIGRNPRALKVAFAECDALERSTSDPMAICKLRDTRHWFRLAYGDTLHAYPADQLRRILLDAIAGFAVRVRVGSSGDLQRLVS